MGFKQISMAVALLMVFSSGCASLSREPTERERTAALGGLAGGAAGAIIGSFAGSAVAGGLFGIPLGAVAGYYIGDQMASRDETSRSRADEREQELDRLRRENERLRREDRPATSGLQQREQARPMAQGTIQSEQNITDRQAAGAQESAAQQRQAQTQTQREDTSRSAQQPTSAMQQQPRAASQRVSLDRDELRHVQRKLKEMGYDAGKVDGIWGPNTQAAVRNFQQSKGLQPTGTLDQETARALGIDSGESRR
jgi:hypothetical protein